MMGCLLSQLVHCSFMPACQRLDFSYNW